MQQWLANTEGYYASRFMPLFIQQVFIEKLPHARHWVYGILQTRVLEWVAISLNKFIPRYLVLFVALVNGIDSLISLSDFLLLVYRNVSDFYQMQITTKFSDSISSFVALYYYFFHVLLRGLSTIYFK